MGVLSRVDRIVIAAAAVLAVLAGALHYAPRQRGPRPSSSPAWRWRRSPRWSGAASSRSLTGSARARPAWCRARSATCPSCSSASSRCARAGAGGRVGDHRLDPRQHPARARPGVRGRRAAARAAEFNAVRARTLIALMILAVAAMLVPSLASYVHAPAATHEHALSVIAAIVLLTVFALSLAGVDPARPRARSVEDERLPSPRWPMPVAIVLARGHRRAGRRRLGLVRRRADAGAEHAAHLPDLRRPGHRRDRGQRGRERGRDPAGRPQPGRPRAVGHPELAAADRARAGAVAGAALAGDRRRDLHAGLPAAARHDGGGRPCSR